MQQSATEQQERAPRVRFGVDLQATKAEYRQALWDFRAISVPVSVPDSAALSMNAAGGTQQSPA